MGLCRSLAIVALFLGYLGAATANAQNFGLGIIIGDPTGISAKGYLSQNRAIDGAIAWSADRETRFHVHSDYLVHKPNIFHIEGAAFTLFYGIGLRLISWDYDVDHPRYDEDDDKELSVGPRVPIGISYTFNEPSIELFIEASAILEVLPETDFDLDMGIGGRYFF